MRRIVLLCMLGLFSFVLVGSASAQVPGIGTVQDAVEAVEAPVQDAVEPVKDAVEPVEDAVQDTVEPVEDAVKDTVEPVEDAVQDTVQDTVEPVEDAVKDTGGPVADTVDKTLDGGQDVVGEAQDGGEAQDAAGGIGAGGTGAGVQQPSGDKAESTGGAGGTAGSSEGEAGGGRRVADRGGRGRGTLSVLSILTGPREQQPPQEEGDDLSELIAAGETIGGTFNAEEGTGSGGADDMFRLPTTGAELRALVAFAVMLWLFGFALWKIAPPHGIH